MRRASSNATWVIRCPGKQGICKVMRRMNVYILDGGRSVAPSQRYGRRAAGPISAQRHLYHHKQTCRSARHLREWDTHERTRPQDAP